MHDVRLKQQNDGRWVFVGHLIPMELARKSWDDRYAAVRAAEAIGWACLANGKVVEDWPGYTPMTEP